MLQPKVFVWDVDGTLYRGAPLRSAILSELAREYWKHPLEGATQARILTAHRRALEQLRTADPGSFTPQAHFELSCRLCGCPPAQVRDCLTRWFDELPLTILPRIIRPGLVALLKELFNKRIPLAILSDYEPAPKIAAMGLSGYFAF